MKKHNMYEELQKKNNIEDDDELFYQLSSSSTNPQPYQQQELYDELMLILTTPPNPNPNAPQSSSLHHFPTQGSTTHQQPHIVDHDLLVAAAISPDAANIAPEVNRDLNPSHSIGEEGGGDKKRKVVHREIERQRRQDMASLYASLRSHLPSEMLKGKRSISDHIHETVTYIKHLQKQIQGLNDRKSHLKRISLDPLTISDYNSIEDSTATPQEINLQKNYRYGDSRVMVKPCMLGVEVSIDTDITQGIPLQRVLGFLLQEQGLTVIRCTSTRINHRMLHFIESEVINDRRENSYVCDLQPRLNNYLLLGGKS